VDSTLIARDDGPAVEIHIALDLLRRALWVAPVLIVLFGAIWGLPGAASTAYAIALVVGNFLLAAALLSWTARISLSLMMATALFGYLVRLAIIFAAVWVVRDASWVEIVPLGIAIVVTHLGLLFWEMRYVSATLAYPGLKPATKGS
jgi:hypothetical protein